MWTNFFLIFIITAGKSQSASTRYNRWRWAEPTCWTMLSLSPIVNGSYSATKIYWSLHIRGLANFKLHSSKKFCRMDVVRLFILSRMSHTNLQRNGETNKTFVFSLSCQTYNYIIFHSLSFSKKVSSLNPKTISIWFRLVLCAIFIWQCYWCSGWRSISWKSITTKNRWQWNACWALTTLSASHKRDKHKNIIRI